MKNETLSPIDSDPEYDAMLEALEAEAANEGLDDCQGYGCPVIGPDASRALPWKGDR